MAKIIQTSRARVIVNGVELECTGPIELKYDKNTFEDIIEITTHGKICKIPKHQCRRCLSEWTISSNDEKCMNCGSNDIEHSED